jgi:hypothetical protein
MHCLWTSCSPACPKPPDPPQASFINSNREARSGPRAESCSFFGLKAGQKIAEVMARLPTMDVIQVVNGELRYVAKATDRGETRA